jgi:hypothetical protein
MMERILLWNSITERNLRKKEEEIVDVQKIRKLENNISHLKYKLILQ